MFRCSLDPVLVNDLGALKLYSGPLIIVDSGTAINGASGSQPHRNHCP
jgi:hypothetical protein